MKMIDLARKKQVASALNYCRSLLDRHRDFPLRIRLLWAAMLTALGVGLRFLLEPLVGERLSYDFPIAFILCVAWFAGVWPAVFSLVASFAATMLLFPPVLGGAAVLSWEIVHFVVPASVGIALIEFSRRARHRLIIEKGAVEHEVRRRCQSESELALARQALLEYASGLEAAVSERTSELQQALQFQRNFSYVIAHDLRAPLRAIVGFTNLLFEKRDEGLISEDWKLLARVHNAAVRMDLLVNGLVELGRVANASLMFRRINLDRVVEIVIAETREQMALARGSLIVDSPLGDVWADEGMLDRVLLELIHNSLQFAKPGVAPEIRIHTKSADDVVTLCVCDNGVGIERAYHEKVFGCFQTLQPPQPQHPGAGLAIVAEAAARMHARVRLESEAGEGACFQIILPRRAPAHPVDVSHEVMAAAARSAVAA